jgi:hypothetical protein
MFEYLRFLRDDFEAPLPLPPTHTHFGGYQNFKVTPSFVGYKGNDIPLMYGTRVIFITLFQGFFKEIVPLIVGRTTYYVRTIFKKFIPLVEDIYWVLNIENKYWVLNKTWHSYND